MADAENMSPVAAPKKGLMGRLILPVILLAAGGAAGVGAMMAMPMLEQGGAEPKPSVPLVAPLEYVEIDNNFTSNLKDSGRFVQLRIAISTQGGTPVVEAVNRHKPAIVSAVLGVISETTEAELADSGGRERLTRQMRLVINDVLQRKSGIAGIDDVFVTSLVQQ